MKRQQIEFRRFNHTLGEMEYSSEMAGGLEQFFSNDCCDELSEEYLFTGVLDCKGAKIFESDIVEVSYDCEPPSIHAVRWSGNEYPAFEFSPELGCDCNGFSHIYNCGETTVTVIGNIHQHKELLGDTK